MFNQKGFSLKEFLAVILIIGALCTISVPLYDLLQNSYNERQLTKTIERIQTGLAQYKTEKNTFPNVLDAEPINQFCKKCFGMILNRGIKNKRWYKAGQNDYLFSKNGHFKKNSADTSLAACSRITYSNVTGNLTTKMCE
ncbi:MAG: type II secretion system protein [Deltaproteobacteria bacterium]|nr:type II secretion system protein [Deltaproteobacteria bacterium]